MVGHDTLVVMVRHGGDLSKYSPLLSPCNRAQARGLAWPIASWVLWPGPPLELQTSTVQMLPLRWCCLEEPSAPVKILGHLKA